MRAMRSGFKIKFGFVDLKREDGLLFGRISVDPEAEYHEEGDACQNAQYSNGVK